MEFEVFEEIAARTREEKPLLFELEHDRVPTEEEIMAFQDRHQILLPEKYRRFLQAFGGGFFGYANVYSLDQNSSFYILRNNPDQLGDLLFVADNGCGDYYAFRMEGRRCGEEIVFCDHETGAAQDTGFGDILEYLVKTGLGQ